MTERPAPPSSRLERALATWLEHVESGSGDDAALLAEHADLRDLLEPMLSREAAPAGPVRIVGDFEIRAELGRGGMGVVHEAWQRSLGRRVALKVLAPALAADPAAIARFHREAAAAGKLRHPNLVEVHGVGHDGDVHWFAMALIDGLPLHRCRERFADAHAAVQLTVQVLDALQHAHGAGLVHRDVKPANVLVRTDGSAVLTDFGLARATGSPTVTAEAGFLGTLDYAPPEQLQAQAVDARADVWSTGVMLAELLTGRHPFSRDTATATLHAILTAEPQGVAALRSRDADLAAIVGRALEKEPARRYPSAVAFLADLRAWQQGLEVAARAPSMRERIARWARREPWRAAAAALLLLGVPLLATIGGYLWANAPRIAAATRAEREARREEAITAAWLALDEERPADGLAVLEPWTHDDTDLEVRFTQSSLLSWVRPREMLRPLAPFTGTRVHEWMAALQDPDHPQLPFRLEDVQATTMLECAVISQAVLYQVRALLLDESAYVHAEKWAGRAVALSPRPRAWLLLGWANAASRAKNERAFADALASYEAHFPGTRGLQLLYVYGATSVPIEAGLAMLSSPDLDGDPRVLIARGQLLQRGGRMPEAIAAFEKALALQPARTKWWQQLARWKRLTSDLPGALHAAQRGVEVDERSEEAHGLLGAVLMDLGRFAEGRDRLQRAVALGPNDWHHVHNLGLAFHELRDDQDALECFEKAARLAPTEPEPYACMARSLRRMNRSEEALAAEIRADALAPGDFRRATTLAIRALEVGLYDLARETAEFATRLAPSDDGVWWRLAEVNLETQPMDPAAAAAAVARAVAIDKSVSPREHALWGRSEAANGRVESAIEHLELALRDDKLPPVSRERAENALRQMRSR